MLRLALILLACPALACDLPASRILSLRNPPLYPESVVASAGLPYAATPLRLTEGAATVATPRGGAHTPIVPLPPSAGLLLGALAALALVGMKRRV